MLCEKQKYIAESGANRYVQRTDFDDEEVCAIKAYLGPWPRALEAAGLKPARDDGGRQRNEIKHINSKRRRTEALKAVKKETDE